MILLCRNLYAQDVVGSGLEQELLSLRSALETGIPEGEGYDALVRLARLYGLAGDAASAAECWLGALALRPADIFAQVQAAYSLASIGEWERALQLIREPARSAGNGPETLRARYLDATLMAWLSSDLGGLIALAGSAGALSLRPVVYYTLWWTLARDPLAPTFSAEVWRTRLLQEFPGSPEALILAPTADGNDPVVHAIYSPLWLLLPGSLAESAGGTPAGIQGESPSAQAPEPAPVAASPAGESGTTFPQGQQTGLFRSRENAQAQAENLQRSGFGALVLRRSVGGEEYWAVVIPSGDPARTARELRALGLDSFTVRIE